MPPKQQQPNKKSQEKMKAKIIEDKTFGLKNKKGAKQQKFIQQVQKQVANKMTAKNPRDIPGEDKVNKKEEEKKKKEEIAQLFKPVVQTVAKGVDPKSVVCVYFKQNLCQKGDKCKFSHDLSKERKSEKRNIYEDTRESGDTMENWDEQKLEDVVNKKHGEDNVKKNQTQIVCKYFIEAVENKTYGWFWQCPNGESCIYRHALPPGFTLKSEAKKKDDEEEVSLEMLVEKERASLGSKVTRVTLETFLAWKARKLQEKRDEFKKQDEKKRNDYKLGFMNGLTGRDIFTFNPDLIANDDEDAENDIDYRQREDEDEDEALAGQALSIRDLNADFFAAQAREADGTGTIATDDRFSYIDGLIERENQRLKEIHDIKKKAEEEAAAAAAEEAEDENQADEGDEDDDEDDENENGQDEEDEQDENEDENEAKESLKKLITNNNTKNKAKNGDVEIDESLFNVEELQDLDEELEKLDL